MAKPNPFIWRRSNPNLSLAILLRRQQSHSIPSFQYPQLGGVPLLCRLVFLGPHLRLPGGP